MRGRKKRKRAKNTMVGTRWLLREKERDYNGERPTADGEINNKRRSQIVAERNDFQGCVELV